MSTWRNVHAGDVVVGADLNEWGVTHVDHDDPRGTAFTLTRYGRTVTGYPLLDAEVAISTPGGFQGYAAACTALATAYPGLTLIEESYRVDT